MSRRSERAGRHPIRSLKDGGFLHGAPPALWGIVPTRTPIDQAREILRTKRVLAACEEYGDPRAGIRCWPYFNLYHEGGVVKFVEFAPSVDVTVAEVIAARGVPDAALSAYTDFPDGSIYTVLILYYDALWTSLTLVEQVPRTYAVRPDTRVARIAYSKPSRHVTGSPHRVPWQGYRDYPASDATGA